MSFLACGSESRDQFDVFLNTVFVPKPNQTTRIIRKMGKTISPAIREIPQSGDCVALHRNDKIELPF